MTGQENPRTLTIKIGEKRDAHNKIYTEGSIKEFIEKFSEAHGLSFSEAGRDFLLMGIKASGAHVELRKP